MSTFAEYHAINSLLENPKIITQCVANAENRSSEGMFSDGSEVGWDTVCKYTEVNMDEIDQVGRAKLNAKGEQTLLKDLQQTNSAETFDSFYKHITMGSAERQSALLLANRGPLYIMNLKVFNNFWTQFSLSQFCDQITRG